MKVSGCAARFGRKEQPGAEEDKTRNFVIVPSLGGKNGALPTCHVVDCGQVQVDDVQSEAKIKGKVLPEGGVSRSLRGLTHEGRAPGADPLHSRGTGLTGVMREEDTTS